jgi:hypothetical protein
MIKVIDSNPKVSDLDAILAGQLVLPEERRKASSYALVASMSPEVKEARRVVATKLPPPVPPPVDPILAAIDRVVAILADRITEQVVRGIADRVNPIRSGSRGDYPSDPEFKPANGPNPPKPGVLIVGLNRLQMDSISREYADRLSLRFLSAEEALVSSTIFRAHTVLMTKFISHSVQTKYRKNKNLVFCNGGLSLLETELDKIVAASVVAA